jgi:hypothetical protein
MSAAMITPPGNTQIGIAAGVTDPRLDVRLTSHPLRRGGRASHYLMEG